MKKWLGMLTVAALTSTHAMGSGLGGFAGYWDSKDADDAIGVGAVLRLDIDYQTHIDIRGSFYSFEEKEGGLTATLDVIPLEAALIFSLSPSGQIQPYIGGGIGYYFADIELKGGGEKLDVDVDDEIGFFALAGLDVSLTSAFSLFGEVKYTWLKYDKAKISDLGDERFDIDLKMDGIGVNVGLMLKF